MNQKIKAWVAQAGPFLEMPTFSYLDFKKRTKVLLSRTAVKGNILLTTRSRKSKSSRRQRSHLSPKCQSNLQRSRRTNLSLLRTQRLLLRQKKQLKKKLYKSIRKGTMSRCRSPTTSIIDFSIWNYRRSSSGTPGCSWLCQSTKCDIISKMASIWKE